LNLEIVANVNGGLHLRGADSYHGWTYEQGRKIGMKDGIAALWYIFRFNSVQPLEDSFCVLPGAGSARRVARRKDVEELR